ncbi:MAG: PepSY domain-containing protein, partial [Eubacteriales bacterium]|nr:PepSY domain-containing protein [Eubacteriales bacterium]
MDSNFRNEEVTHKETKTPRRWFKIVAPIALAFVLVFGVWFGSSNYSTAAVVAFDVNPSIELSVNRSEKIIKVNSRNMEAHEVVGDMRLKGVNLDVAVNALVGSMVQKGYITDMDNAILITVNSNDSEMGEQLQERLTSEVSTLLKGLSVDGAVLAQSADDDFAEDLAEKYGISRSKASLIEKLIAQDPTLTYEDVVDLSINDISLLIESRQTDIEQVKTSGHASDKKYIGYDRATSIAFSHAEVNAEEVRELEVELDTDDGYLIYEVEFKHNNTEYEYDIDAISGKILKFETDGRGVSRPSDPQGTDKDSSSEIISQVAALDIALKHAGVTRNQLHDLEIELDRDDGRRLYEIEFEVGNTEYEYDIDAVSGRILKSEVDGRQGSKTSDSQQGSTKPSTSSGLLSQDAALDIALKHAGVTRNQLRELEIELDRDDGRRYYEIEFEVGNTEYEYDIDAVSGRILDFEIDHDDDD